MSGCTFLVTGIPNPLPPSPVFLYLDKNGKPLPPPNYVPSLDDCGMSGCDCGCSGSGGSSGGCGCGSAQPGMAGGCGGDAGAKQLEAVNALLQLASKDFAVSSVPGWLQAWDGSSGTFTRQYSVPTVDALAPTPVFTYSSHSQTASGEFGAAWSMIFKQWVTSVNTSTAVLNKGAGVSFTYSNKNTGTGVYSAPPNVLNKLVQTANGWTETQPDGLLLNYNSSGQLATIKRGTNVWTMSYDPTWGLLKTITDPVSRRASFVYQTVIMGQQPKLRRFVDVVGRITTFSMVQNQLVGLRSIKSPTQQITTFGITGGGQIGTWIEPTGARTTYTYNNYQPISIIDPSGNTTVIGYATGTNNYRDANNYTTTYMYTSSGQPSSVINPLGQRATLLWTGGYLRAAIDTAGHRTSLTYATMSDGRKFVSTLQTPQGTCYTWLYDSSDRLRATIDPLGHRSSYVWDSNNNRTAQVDPVGNRTSFLYTSGGQLRAVIDPLGARTTALFDSTDRVRVLINPLGARTTFAYNSLSQPGPVTGPTGCLTTTLYDNQNRVRAVIDPFGARTTYTYDQNSRLRMVIDPLNHINTTLYDPDGHVRATIDPLSHRTTLAYDPVGNLKAITNPLGFVRTTLYDPLNRVRAQIDPVGARTTLGYDLAGNQNTVKNPLGNVSTSSFDSNHRLVATINPVGARTSYGYDSSSRLVRITNALGYINSAVYDSNGRMRATVDAFGNRVTLGYDSSGRQITSQDQLGHVTTTVYDSAGRVRASVDPLGARSTFGHDASGNQTSQQNPLGAIWTTLYDCLSRTRATIDPLSHRSSFAYDAASRMTAVQDANNNRTSTVYDAANRPVATISALGNRVTQVFDATSRRTAIVDARGNRYSFVFDAADRQIRQVDPLTRSTTFGFDAASQRTLRIDARGNRTSFVFDNAGRQVKMLYPDGSRVTMGYDAVSNRTVLADATGRYTTLYDAVDRPRAVTNPTADTITYAYDAASRRRYMIEPDGGRFTYGFDADGRNTLVVNPQSDRTSWTFDAAGRNTVQLLANGIRVSLAYDSAGRLVRLANLASTGATITSFRDTWDAVGNRLARVEADGTLNTWTYDNTYQLTRERRNGANSFDTTYSYDPSGNRRLKFDNAVRTTYSYDAANQLQTFIDNTGTTTFTFDGSGNQRTQQTPSSGTTTNTWDFENRLIKVALPAGILNTFTYNGDGLRVERQDSSGTLKQVWDGLRILEETDQNNVVQAVYTLSDGIYGDLVSQWRSGAGSYFLFDPLGSANRLTNGSQGVTDSYLFKAFGEILLSGTTVNPFGFVGKLGYYFDADPSWHSLREREYTAAFARFLSVDPMQFAIAQMPYAYSGNRAVTLTDPSGLQYGSPAQNVDAASVTIAVSEIQVPGGGEGLVATITNPLGGIVHADLTGWQPGPRPPRRPPLFGPPPVSSPGGAAPSPPPMRRRRRRGSCLLSAGTVHQQPSPYVGGGLRNFCDPGFILVTDEIIDARGAITYRPRCIMCVQNTCRGTCEIVWRKSRIRGHLGVTAGWSIVHYCQCP